MSQASNLYRKLAAALLTLSCAACGSQPSMLPSGQAAYAVAPEGDVLRARDYLIGPLDVLQISVFREPDLSVEKVPVDSDGNVQVPLIGPIAAAGLTSSQLARSLETKFGQRYLVDPRISVTIVESSRQRVTVDGAVGKAGVYEMPGRMSLIDAIALAQGLNQVAKSNEVAIIRRVDGKRVGGLFDVDRIRAGIDPDPEVIAGDQIIVGTSAIRQAWRDVLQAAPLLAIFRPFG